MNFLKLKKIAQKFSWGKAIGFTLLFFLFSTAAAHSVVAQMSGTLYKIQSDTINIGGGEGDSTLYKLFGTVGEVASGESSSSQYTMNAGFLNMQFVYLAISSGSDVTMSPAIAGVSGGIGAGSTSWTVTTDNPAGYSLSIRADSNPALQSLTSDFDDYAPSGSDPDYTWTVATTASEYGFTPEGSHIVQRFKDNGSACNTGSGDTADRCWAGLTTSDQTIAQSGSANHPSGTTTTVKMQAEVGADFIQPNGTYEANVTVTAVSL